SLAAPAAAWTASQRSMALSRRISDLAEFPLEGSADFGPTRLVAARSVWRGSPVRALGRRYRGLAGTCSVAPSQPRQVFLFAPPRRPDPPASNPARRLPARG